MSINYVLNFLELLLELSDSLIVDVFQGSLLKANPHKLSGLYWCMWLPYESVQILQSLHVWNPHRLSPKTEKPHPILAPECVLLITRSLFSYSLMSFTSD